MLSKSTADPPSAARMSVSKAGINMLTQSVATAFGRKNIRCNAVAASMVLPPYRRPLKVFTEPGTRRSCIDHFVRPCHVGATVLPRVLGGQR
ncbi:SDR family oxidoreductase [Novosphingobium subterraneum]|uniref:SDR family oxidoreductase n=1 Tax=Novosphingobium subterraneum TaxID=48936 RepID=UPI003CFE4D9F